MNNTLLVIIGIIFTFSCSYNGETKLNANTSKNITYGMFIKSFEEGYNELNKDYIKINYLSNLGIKDIGFLMGREEPKLSKKNENTFTNTVLDIAKTKLAMSVLLTLPGKTILIKEDQLDISTIKFDSLIEDNSLHKQYLDLLKTRQESEVLSFGGITESGYPSKEILSFTRNYEGKSLVVYHNLTSSDFELIGMTGKKVFYSTDNSTIEMGILTLKPYSSAIVE